MAKNKPIFDKKKALAVIEKGRRAKWWRRMGGKSSGFYYRDAKNARLTDDSQLERIKSLVIPPAWKYVRISPSATGKIQAVGMDTTGRVQYLYNPQFRAKQEKKKFAKIEKFGEYLPQMRQITNQHLELEGFPREKVLALMTRLINSLYIRLGSEKSVKHYKTYGITTLQNRHLEIKKGGKLVFKFVGKHHIKHRKILVDADLAMILKDLQSFGGVRKLFNYEDETGRPNPVKSADINRYLKEVTAPEFSAKDFRTWGGTILAAEELAEIGRCDDPKLINKNIVKAVKKVAEELGNTPAVCRSSYIHPTVIDSYQKGITILEFTKRKKRRIRGLKAGLAPEERALIQLFKTTAGKS
jgi:DNA topoisomerase I